MNVSRFLVRVAISSLSVFPSAAKFFEQRIRWYSSASIPQGPAEPFVFRAESKIRYSLIRSNVPGRKRSTGPCRRQSSSISAGTGCFSFNWANTSSDRFNSLDEFSLPSNLIAAVSFPRKTNFANVLDMSSADLALLELTNLS